MLAAAFTAMAGCASTKKAKVKNTPFKKTPSGISYKILKDAREGGVAKEGDYVELHIQTWFEDSLIFSSKEETGGKSVAFPVGQPRFNGDLSEAFFLLTPGDSAIFLVPVDTLKANNQTMQPWMKEGKNILYSIELVSIKSVEELQKMREEKAQAAGDPNNDDETLSKYFKEHKLSPEKRASGLYYIITEETDDEKPIPGQTVKVHYTGRLMDGTIFDSSTGKDPLSFSLGRGHVIQGWDEGIALLKRGEKATLYIPSRLAYGDRSPSAKIPPNSILIFDVELVDF